MRRSALLLSALPMIACGGGSEPPPRVAVVTVSVASAPPAPPPPAPLPPEPEGLTVLAAPSKVCELSGTLDADGLELAVVAGKDAFGEVSHVPVTVAFAEQGAFAETRGPSWVLRGSPSAESARVRPARWLAFGGVLYAGASDRLLVKAARGGRLVLAAPESGGFTLADGAGTVETPCDGVAIDADPHGALQDLPAAFATDKERAMLLARRKPVPVSADPGGPAGGTIDAVRGEPARVTLLERRGAKARVRWGHVAGWVDASLLTPPKPVSDRRLAMLQAAQFGMIGLLGSGIQPATDHAASSEPGTTLVCTADVRILANVPAAGGAGPARFVIGTVPAGKPLHITDRGPEIAHLSIDDGLFEAGQLRLAVPARDIAAGCTPSAEPSPGEKTAHVTTPGVVPAEDAVDKLGGDGPERASTDVFGVGGLGLVGVGEGAGGRGEGIGLGSIGTLRHGAGTGAGQGFGSGHGRLGSAQTTSAPALREGAVKVNGRLPPEVVQRIVRQNFGRFRLCYQTGLDANATLAGKVTVHFVIDRSGAVASTGDGGSDLPNPGVVSCVVRAFSNLSFPQPEGGIVVVDYSMQFFPLAPG